MNKKLAVLSALVVTLGSAPIVAQAQSWSFLIPETEITNATGALDMDSAEMATDGGNLFAVVDIDTTTDEKIVLVNTSLTAGAQGTVIANATALKTAIDAANGTAANYTASTLRIQAVGFNTAGKILAFMDDGTNSAALVAIDSVTPFAINVLSCAVDAGTSPVEGATSMFMQGDIAYLLVENEFGASEDKVLSVDTSTIVNNGGAVVTTVIGSIDLLVAAGQTATDYRHNAGTALSATELLISNSGKANSNDNILKITLGAPNTVSTYILATEIEAESGASDVGFNAMTMDPEGRLYLANAFGTGASDDSIFIVNSVTSSSDISLTVDLEATIASDISGTDLFIGGGSLAYNASRGAVCLFSGGAGSEGVLQKITGTQEVDVTGGPLNFSAQDIAAGATAAQTITITNAGTAPLTFTGAGIALAGTDSADFAITNSPSTAPLIPGASVTVDISFDPTTVGAKTATLDVTTDDGDEATVQVNLSGTGTTGSSVADWLTLN